MILLSESAGAQSVAILFDDFSAPDYVSGSLNAADSGTNPDDQSFMSFAPLATGGNPGAVAVVFHEHSVVRDGNEQPINGDGSTFLQSLHVDQSTRWDPAVDGALESLEVRIDLQLLEPSGSAVMEQVYFIVEDSNGGSAAGFTPIAPTSGWQTIVVDGLTNADFAGHDLAGSLPLGFGFGFVSSGDVSGSDEQLAIDVDNFEVRGVPVPEPSAALLLIAGVTAIASTRKRPNTATARDRLAWR